MATALSIQLTAVKYRLMHPDTVVHAYAGTDDFADNLWTLKLGVGQALPPSWKNAKRVLHNSSISGESVVEDILTMGQIMSSVCLHKVGH